MEKHKTTGKYILDKDGEAVEETDLFTWANWFENSMGQRRVALTKIGKYTVSTVFISIDYSFGGKKPILFETMIFNDKDRECGEDFDMYTERYSTRKEALLGHEKIVEEVKKKQKDE